MLWSIYIVFILLSFSRILALSQFYNSSLSIYKYLDQVPPPNHNATEWKSITKSTKTTAPAYARRELFVCAGKEWYRFPSHFLLPVGFKFQFIESRFRGLLPHHFYDSDVSSNKYEIHGLKEYHDFMKWSKREYTHQVDSINDLNQYQEDKVVSIEKCDYLIDSVDSLSNDLDADPYEPNYGKSGNWKEFQCLLFINTAATKFPARAFYFGNTRVWKEYCLYIRSK